MSLRTSVLAASGIALAAAVLPGIVAAPQEKPARGARVAVVAYHDSRLFTLCPVFGKDVIESNLWMSGMKAKVTVFYPPTGGQAIGLHFDAEQHARAALPMPAESSPGGLPSRPPASAPGELDRLARDIGVERRLDRRVPRAQDLRRLSTLRRRPTSCSSRKAPTSRCPPARPTHRRAGRAPPAGPEATPRRVSSVMPRASGTGGTTGGRT